MAKYQELIYGSGIFYGETSRVAFNAEPMSAVALSHDTIQVTWTKPSNTTSASYKGFRIVRNQDAFPETEEDGAILYEFFTRTGEVVDKSSFIDGKDATAREFNTPLVSGKFTYYRAWILLDEAGEWVRAGDAYALLPDAHVSGTSADTVVTIKDELGLRDVNVNTQPVSTTHTRMLDYIPRVFTSAATGPTDAIAPYDGDNDPAGKQNNSLLSQFLQGFSLTVDEMLNYAEFINPELRGQHTAPNILALQSQQLHIPQDPAGASRSQKALVREAMYTYRRKGTLNGLQTLVEGVTGYNAEITESPNLMLSPQDSTFFEGTGNWLADPITAMVEANAITIATPTSVQEPSAIDLSWVGKVTVFNNEAVITNGVVSPITRGIPVTGGETYQLSYWAYIVSGSAPTVWERIHWFDRNGKLISTSQVASGSRHASGTSWTRGSYSATAPSNAVYAGISFQFNIAGTWYLDMIDFRKGTSSSGSFKEARGVDIFLTPRKINRLSVPSFDGTIVDVQAYGWTIDSASSSVEANTVGGVYYGPTGARAGLKRLRLTSHATGTTVLSANSVDGNPTGSMLSKVLSVPNEFYTFSIWARVVDEDTSATATATISLGATDKQVTLTTDWQRVYVTAFIENAQSLAVTFSGDWAGAVIDVDAAQLERSYYPTDYFDGSLTLAGGTYLEDINANPSAFSAIYPSVNNRITRLSSMIESYLPLNTPYTVDLYQNDGAIVPPKGIA